MELDDVYQEVKDKMTDYQMKVGSNNGHVYAFGVADNGQWAQRPAMGGAYAPPKVATQAIKWHI